MALLHLEHVSLDYPIYHGNSRSLKKSLLARSTQGNLARDALADRVSVRALTDINLHLKDGDRLGLIGPNGAGKTTLLKVLASIFEPTHGHLITSGRVSALLDTAVGLNPEATGRENIVLRGMFMDIHPGEMRRHAADIAAFTELGGYLEMPVRTYSAGMMVRLAFAISTCIPPEILVMDEWLAAGDARFLAKAHKRMETFVEASSILVLASHSLPLIEQWCSSAIFLDQGHVIAHGDVKDVAEAYRQKVQMDAAMEDAA
jgi:ABC-type polysaccharide/polyol phosphate transport system ATPase subunit